VFEEAYRITLLKISHSAHRNENESLKAEDTKK
jgi:hypothetical protein